LYAKRSDIEAFCLEYQLAFREDSSNASDKYQRNLIRHQVVPVLKQLNPSLEETAYANFEHLKDSFLIFRREIERYRKKLIEPDKDGFYIHLAKLNAVPGLSTVLYYLLKDFGFNASHIQQLCSDLKSTNSRTFSSSTHRLIKERRRISILKLSTEERIQQINELDTEFKTVEGKWQISCFKINKEEPLLYAKNSIVLDADMLKFPLLIRNWRQGDYFYPLGMNRKKKKISDFFMQLKLSVIEKETIPLVFSEKQLVAVLPLRPDERYKVTEKTERVCKIELIAAAK
jgi:tRNA(Ile)-lysidine synthase